jgi:outer membrane lipase/esterase
MLNKLTRLIITSITIICCGLSSTAQALSYNKISQVYFFGDSLTDSGFNDVWSVPTPLPVGKAPTFTTFGGYTWAQYIARDIKGISLPIYPGPVPADAITNNAIYAGNPIPGFVSGTLAGIDYAAGGSTTGSPGFNETWAPSLVQQVNYYLSTTGQVADPNAVYFIWSGANDILSLLASSPTQLQLLTAANNAAINIGNAVALLSAKGAKRIVVMSLPSLGSTPLINGLAIQTQNPTLPATMKTLTFTFNSMLNTQLGRVIAQYGTKVLYVDVYALFNNVILATQTGQPYVVAAQSFKFVNYTTPACGAVSTAIYCPNGTPTNYLFADTLHPTDMAHRVLSLQVETLIQNWT